MSSYGIGRTLTTGFADAVRRTRAALSDQGFGVLTEIDVAAVMKARLGVELRPYLILGACNPPLAHQALAADPSIGLLLPCNVVVRDVGDGTIRVEAVDPDVMTQLSGEPGVVPVAAQASAKLRAAMDALGAAEAA